MTSKKDFSHPTTPRENFLMSLLDKVVKEYKTLLEHTRQSKPLKIIKILNVSPIPGETRFDIQITHKNCVINLSSADLIKERYNLNDFSDFHAEIIRQSAQGKLIEFLKLSEHAPIYKIVSKRFDPTLKQYIFTIETKENIRFNKSAEELSKNKHLLSNINMQDIYDIAFTHGTESILNEKMSLLLAKKMKYIKNSNIGIISLAHSLPKKYYHPQILPLFLTFLNLILLKN